MAGDAAWNLDPPPGFQGMHPHRRLKVYQRHLPHWRQPGATYFVTFRLNDSLPKSRLRELNAFRTDWQRRHPPRDMDGLWRESFRRVDRWLDQGFGRCELRHPLAATIVEKSLQYFDQQRYELGCYVVMSNHVHLVVRPYDEDDEALQRILHSWKRYMGREINQLLREQKPLWQNESFDRLIRDEEHLWRTIQYIGRNPRRAKLTDGNFRLWIRPAWEERGWGFAKNE